FDHRHFTDNATGNRVLVDDAAAPDPKRAVSHDIHAVREIAFFEKNLALSDDDGGIIAHEFQYVRIAPALDDNPLWLNGGNLRLSLDPLRTLCRFRARYAVRLGFLRHCIILTECRPAGSGLRMSSAWPGSTVVLMGLHYQWRERRGVANLFRVSGATEPRVKSQLQHLIVLNHAPQGARSPQARARDPLNERSCY